MISKLTFGRTGHESTRTLFGAAALGQVSQEDADRTLEVLLKYGVNHIDTAASYGDSELRIAPWMKDHRQDFFLATKTGERGYKKAKEEIHRSLERLKVDYVDLLQLHNLSDRIEWQIALGSGGALEAAIEAKQQGLVKHIGVTGHNLTIAAMHLMSLEHFDFDSVLLPYNFTLMQIPKYAADFNALVQLCQERNVAVQTIKSTARRGWNFNPPTRTTWYEPLEEQGDIDIAAHWVLSRPGIFLNTVGDIHLLPKVLDAASRFENPVSDEAARALVESQEMTPLFV